MRGSERTTWKYNDCYLNALYMEKKEKDGEGL